MNVIIEIFFSQKLLYSFPTLVQFTSFFLTKAFLITLFYIKSLEESGLELS